MKIKDIIKGLRVHQDQKIDCENCPLNDMPLCFDWLINETVSALEKAVRNEID